MRFATAEELIEYVADEREIPADVERLLDRASEVVDDAILGGADRHWADPLPDPLTARQEALRDATCAQVEFWLEWGEEHDIEGLAGPVSLASLRLDKLPPVLARRARRHLRRGDLLSAYAGAR